LPLDFNLLLMSFEGNGEDQTFEGEVEDQTTTEEVVEAIPLGSKLEEAQRKLRVTQRRKAMRVVTEPPVRRRRTSEEEARIDGQRARAAMQRLALVLSRKKGGSSLRDQMREFLPSSSQDSTSDGLDS
jgi:hypothetical protein